MKESVESINLMRLNCELINLSHSAIYMKGVNASHKTFSHIKERTLEFYKKAGLWGAVKRMLMYVIHRKNDTSIIDFHISFRERKVEDFVINNYHNVGKGVVYTAIYGKYDKLTEPMYVNPNLDYYAFTDQEIPEGSVWKKMDLASFPQLSSLDDYHRAKYFKLFPYEFFTNYDFSIWVDGNVKLVADIYPLAIMADDSAMATFENPHHDCIYTEKKYMVYYNRVNEKAIEKQVDDYRKDGFPEHYGMREFSIIYRNHHNEECYGLMKEWWSHCNQYTMRDQISLPYILWKHGKCIEYIKSLGENWRWNPRFIFKPHDSLVIYK